MAHGSVTARQSFLSGRAPGRRSGPCRGPGAPPGWWRGPSSAAVLGPALVAVALAAAGCGSGESEAPRSTITVTVPPSTEAGTDAGASAAPTSSAEAADDGDVPTIDRGFDAAFVGDWNEQADTVVLSIDRLTVVGLSDEQLASGGAPIEVHRGERFVNQSVRFYEVGVSGTARWVMTTCERADSGPALSSLPVAAEDFLATPGLAAVPVIIEYRDGLVDRIETNPAC